MSPRHTSSSPIVWNKHTWIDLAIILLLAGVVMLGSWPIYEKYTLFLAGFTAAISGMVLGLTFVTWSIRWYSALFYTYLTYFLTALVSAVPWIYNIFPYSFLHGVKLVALGPVLSWKTLLTIAIPVGSFEDTQLPIFITLFLTTLLATYFLTSPRFHWALALIPLGISLLFPTVFGEAGAAHTIRVASIVIPTPIHQIGGILGFAVLLGWPIVRGRREQRERLKATHANSNVKHDSRDLGARLRQRFRAFSMLAISVSLAALIATPLADMRDRFVARDAVDNLVEVPQHANPLASYRANYSSTLLNTSLVEFKGDIPEYTRFAVLPMYDNIAFRAATQDNDSGVLTQFERIPYRISNTSGELHTTHVSINKYSSPWLPLASEFSQITFEGTHQQDLAGAFYFNRYTQSGLINVNENGASLDIKEADSYQLIYADSDILDETAKNIASMQPNSSADVIRPDEETFANMYRWMKEEKAGASTVGEVIRLRDAMLVRSYLGRSKTEPEGETTWLPDNYVFRASDSGQTAERLENIFQAMSDPKYHKCAEPTDQCAAHVGDEEQYAAATALLAQALGFPSRIVYGAKVPEDGIVTGRDTTVWTEIQTSDGTWIHLGMNVRVDNSFVEQPDSEAYRQYNPAIDQDNAPVVTPPDKDPSTSGQKKKNQDEETPNIWLTYALTAARITGGVALVTLPLWGILLYKLLRKRKRSHHKDPVQRLLGGWNEYLDRYVDSGERVEPHHTRLEMVASHSEGAYFLAQDADYAAFSGDHVTLDEANEYWENVLIERKNLLENKNFWQKLKTHLSINSLGRYRKKKKRDGRFRLRTGERK